MNPIVNLDKADFGQDGTFGSVGRRHDLVNHCGVMFALHCIQGDIGRLALLDL